MPVAQQQQEAGGVRDGDGARRRRLEAVLGVPFTTGNRVDVLRNGTEVFPALLEAVEAATRSIDVLWFLWGRGAVTERMAAALAERAASGVRVRVLLDAFGARGMAPDQLDRMRRAGVVVAFLHPLSSWRATALNLRTHRRVLVCDETVAFTGGVGLDRAWTGDAQDPAHWRDDGYRVTGPAVHGLRSAFARDWLQTGQPLITEADAFPVQPQPGEVRAQVLSASSHAGWNASALTLLTLLDLARERVRIVTPYVRLPERFHAALEATVARGVPVQLLVGGPHADRRLVAAQSRHDYDRLLRAGVELWTYQPTVLHLKLVTVDRAVALVGTTNLDARSVALNEQVALLLDDPSLTARLDEQLDADLDDSRRLDLRSWRGRGRRERLVEDAADLIGKPLRGLGTVGLSGSSPR